MTKVLIVLAKGFEELEAVTTMDLLVRAGIDVVRASLIPGPVKASRNTIIIPDTELDQVLDKEFDAIVLPGGLPGADFLASNESLLLKIQQHVKRNKLVAAICAAPHVLVKANVVEGKTITCYPGALDKFDTSQTTVTENAVEVDLPLITSRGPGTTIDFALTLIEQLTDSSKRSEIEKQLVR